MSTVYNKHSDPCVEEYFKVAKSMPKLGNSLTNVKSDPIEEDADSSGLDTIENSDDIKPLKSSDGNKYDAVITELLGIGKPLAGSDPTKKSTSEYNNGNIAQFEVDMEGVKTAVKHSNRAGKKAHPSELAGDTQQDGYSDRKPSDW